MTHVAELDLLVRGNPIDIDLADVRRQTSGASAIALCAQRAGLLDKIVAADIGIDNAVWTRVKNGQNSLSLEQLHALMVRCGNEAPLNWLLLRCGYDPRSLRRIESDVERENRELRERLAEIEKEREIERRTYRGILNAAA